jgi:ribosomal protein L7/L12
MEWEDLTECQKIVYNETVTHPYFGPKDKIKAIKYYRETFRNYYEENVTLLEAKNIIEISEQWRS